MINVVSVLDGRPSKLIHKCRISGEAVAHKGVLGC